MVFFQHLRARSSWGSSRVSSTLAPLISSFCASGWRCSRRRASKPEYYSVLNNPVPYFGLLLGFGVILTTLGVIQTCGRSPSKPPVRFEHRHHPRLHRHVRDRSRTSRRLDTPSTSSLRGVPSGEDQRGPRVAAVRFRANRAEEEGSDTAPLLDKAGSYPSSPERSARWSSGEGLGWREGGIRAPRMESPTGGELRADTRGGDVGHSDDVNALRES